MNKVRNELRYQLNIQRQSLSSSGFVTLKGQKGITSLEEFGTQHRLKTLDLTGTPLKSLSTLAGQPWLTKLILNNSSIESYEGLSRHPRLEEISATGTALADRPNFRLALVILVGPKLRYINGTKVKLSERQDAASFPRLAKLLIEAGWDPTDKTLSVQEYRKLVDEYDLVVGDARLADDEERFGELINPPAVFVPHEAKSESAADDKVAEAAAKKEEKLVKDLATVLSRIGIRVQQGEKRKEEIVVAVSQLAELAKMVDECADEILGVEEEDAEEDV